MPHTIAVCTDHTLTWDCLRRFSSACPVSLERVKRLEDLAGRADLEVDAVVVDDRFLSILPEVERSARRHWPAFAGTVFMTAGEALNALWTGPLADRQGYSPQQLDQWVMETRIWLPTPAEI